MSATKAFKFTVGRRSIVTEYYYVEADSEEEALAIANNGELDYDNNAAGTTFEDWYEDDFQVYEKEDLCPLTKMVRDYTIEHS